MKLLTQKQIAKLIKNAVDTKFAQQNGMPEPDHKPVVKLFSPVGSATWLLTEMDEDARMFGLCDLGMGCPELGYVMLRELEETVLPFGLKIERDRHWTAAHPLSYYTAAANEKGMIGE